MQLWDSEIQGKNFRRVGERLEGEGERGRERKVLVIKVNEIKFNFIMSIQRRGPGKISMQRLKGDQWLSTNSKTSRPLENYPWENKK